MRARAVVAGVALVAAHAALLPVVLDAARAPELEVRVRGAPVAASFDLAGELPAGLAGAVAHAVDGAGPGLVRARWRLRHRGGFVREVGAAQLVGPFQSPAAPPCGGQLIVGQRFLDAQVAPQVRAALAHELTGFEQFPAGRVVGIDSVELRWEALDDPASDRRVFGDLAAQAGPALAQAWGTDAWARVRVVVRLERVTADVTVALVPRLAGDGDPRLAFELFARAELTAGNRAVDWALARLPIDRYVSRALRDQLDAAMLRAFDPPPPLALPGGRALRVGYCPRARIRRVDGGVALPLALGFDGPGPHGALPVRLGPPPEPAATSAGASPSLAFELDLDTINALLYELWRTGFLDAQLAAAGLDRRFNEDPVVTALLSVRISPLTLALPPVVVPGPAGGLRLRGDLRVAIADRGAVTPARVWAELDVALDPGTAEVGLAAVELACEPEPGRLVPCYADLVTGMKARAGDARAELSALLIRVLGDLVTARRFTAPGAPAALVFGVPHTTARLAGPSGVVRIDVEAHLEEPAPVP